jgi:hypothetical protein
MVSIRILAGCRHRKTLRTGSQRFGFEADKAPALPDHGLGSRFGHPHANGHGLRRFRQRGLPHQSVVNYQGHRPERQNAGREPTTHCSSESMRAVDARNAFVMNRACCRKSRAPAQPPGPRPPSSAPTCTAKQGPPTTRSTTGLRAISPRSSAVVWMGYDNPAVPGRERNRWTTESAGVDQLHGELRSRVCRCSSPPRPKASSTWVASGTTTNTHAAPA